jgi:NAD(P)-dependent dehydrogenase (short-subunit alcohol dehydrogenase family)
MAWLLKDRSVIVAGAGRGIGRVIALAFAREGARMVLAARTEGELAETAGVCHEAGGTAISVVTDVSKWDQVQSLIAIAMQEIGPVNTLVNTAGVIGPIGPTADIDVTTWTDAVEVNLFGAFYLCRAIVPHFIQQRHGKIILLGGGGATAPMPNFSSYAASKAALVRLAETLAEELKTFNIQVNIIAPGLVDTRIQDEVLAAGPRAGTQLEKVRQARETGVGAVPPEVAASLAVFLASSEAGQLTGKLIAAPYDRWREWGSMWEDLNNTPLYTLRRLDPYTIKPLIKDVI